MSDAPSANDLQRPRSSPARIAATVAVTLLLVVGPLAALLHLLPPGASTSRLTVVPSPNVVLAMRDLARLETATFHMERVIELKDQQTHLFGLVESRDALLLVAVGDVTAGVDLEQLSEKNVEQDWAHKTVHVRLPAPEVFSAALDNTRTHVVTRTTDTLAERREDLEGKARAEAERSMKQGALEAGILTRAGTSAEREVSALLSSLGYEHVQVAADSP